MELIRIGENEYINADRVIGINAMTRAQHTDRKRGILGYVDDAAAITLAGSTEPVILLDGQADALRKHLEGPGKPTIDLSGAAKAEAVADPKKPAPVVPPTPPPAAATPAK